MACSQGEAGGRGLVFPSAPRALAGTALGPCPCSEPLVWAVLRAWLWPVLVPWLPLWAPVPDSCLVLALGDPGRADWCLCCGSVSLEGPLLPGLCVAAVGGLPGCALSGRGLSCAALWVVGEVGDRLCDACVHSDRPSCGLSLVHPGRCSRDGHTRGSFGSRESVASGPLALQCYG